MTAHTPTESAPMSVTEFLVKLDERKSLEADIRRNPGVVLGALKQLVAERDALKSEHAEMRALLKALDTPIAEEAERRRSAMDKSNPDSVRYYTEMDEFSTRIDALLGGAK